jgi:hypothetical protein
LQDLRPLVERVVSFEMPSSIPAAVPGLCKLEIFA